MVTVDAVARAVCRVLPGRLTDEEADAAARVAVLCLHLRLEELGDRVYDRIRCGDPHDDSESQHCTRCEDMRDGVDVMLRHLSQYLTGATRTGGEVTSDG